MSVADSLVLNRGCVNMSQVFTVMVLNLLYRYNLMPNNLKKCKRRIKLEMIAGISVSEMSDEFVIHVKEEYDYRFKSVRLLCS